jgi:hypothetical protein
VALVPVVLAVVPVEVADEGVVEAVVAVVAVVDGDVVAAAEEDEEVWEVEEAVVAVVESVLPRMPVISARMAFGKCAALAECRRAKARKHERSNGLDPFIGKKNQS